MLYVVSNMAIGCAVLVVEASGGQGAERHTEHTRMCSENGSLMYWTTHIQIKQLSTR